MDAALNPALILSTFSAIVTVGNLVVNLQISNAVGSMAREQDRQVAANDKEIREWADEKFVTKETLVATLLPHKA